MAMYAWVLILGTAALLLVMTVMGTRRWRAAGLDIDGALPPDDEVPGTDSWSHNA